MVLLIHQHPRVADLYQFFFKLLLTLKPSKPIKTQLLHSPYGLEVTPWYRFRDLNSDSEERDPRSRASAYSAKSAYVWLLI